MRKDIFLVFIALVYVASFTPALHAQTSFTLHGKVTDAKDHSAIEGAAVTVKHTNKTAVTDANGNFSLNIPADTATLVISYVGYAAKEIAVSATFSRNLVIELTPSGNELEQVTVSTGYQVISKERATGSFDHLDSAVVNRGTSPNILNRLEGMASSVLFDKRTGSSVANLQVRGLSTITSSITQPLLIVDNFPYAGSISDINPNDVQSITILKDAAATSIWGAKAGNGVIVITTKKGSFNHPLQVSFNGNVTVTDKPDLFAMPQMSSKDFIGVEQMLFDKGFFSGQLEDTYSYPLISPVVELLAQEQAGTVSNEEVQKQLDVFSHKDIRNDFLKYLYRKALLQQYAVNVQGGGEISSYFVSAGYDKDLQSLKGNGNDRYTVHAENTLRPLRKLSINTSIFFTQTNSTNNSPGGYGSLFPEGIKATYYPYASLADGAGNAAALPKLYRKAFLDTAGGGNLLDWSYRPLDELRYADNTVTNTHAMFHISAQYRLLKSLNAEAHYQYETGNGETRNYYNINTWYARNLINTYTSMRDGAVSKAIPEGGILDDVSGRTTAHDARVQLNYHERFGKNEITAIAGGELRQSHNESKGFRTYGYNDDNLTYANVDYTHYYPTFNDILGDYFIPTNTVFDDATDRFVSVYGNASWMFDDRYILSGSARKDASNLFGVATNQKGVPLWSAGAAWNISKEKFFSNNFLSLLKLRGSYGYSGNVNNSLSALTTLRFLGTSYLTNLPYSSVSNPPDPALRWEKTGMINAGVDFATKDDRVAGSIEYYFKKSSDLIGLVPVDMTSGGYTTLQLNSAELHTRGWDVTLATKNIDAKLKWNTRLLLSVNKNKVAKYAYPSEPYFYVGDGSNISPIEGQPAYNIVSFRFNGLEHETGDPLGYYEGKESKDYNSIVYSATMNDIEFNGSALPQVFGSLRNDFSLGNFNLSFNIIYKFKYYFRRTSINYTQLYVRWLGNSDYAKRWQEPGDELVTTVPSAPYPLNPARDYFYNYSSATVEKGDHIRLQDINLSYDFTKKSFHWLPVKKLTLYAYVNNAGILWRANKAGLDPDIPSGIPFSRSYAFGIKSDL